MGEILVGRYDDLSNGKRVLVEVGNTEICVFAHRAELYAYENQCAHQGGPAAEGVILGRVECVLDDEKRHVANQFSERQFHLVCPWHGWEYELDTGRCVTDTSLGLRKYRVSRRDDQVFVEVPDA